MSKWAPSDTSSWEPWGSGEIANDGPGISTKGWEWAMGTKEETLAGGITTELVNHLGRHGTPARLV